jgi:hypothetical protein
LRHQEEKKRRENKKKLVFKDLKKIIRIKEDNNRERIRQA